MTQSIVLSLCEKYKITTDMFYGDSQDKRVVACRRAAIVAMFKAGISKNAIARLTKRHLSTVQYWLDGDLRERRKKRASELRKQDRCEWIGGVRQTASQRKEIVELYLVNPDAAKALAAQRGLAPGYAYNAANASGRLPLRSELGRTHLGAIVSSLP